MMKQGIWTRAFPLILFAILGLTGCSGSEPPKELLRNYLEIELKMPAPLGIDDLKAEWLANGETAYEGKVKVTFVVNQPLYARATLNEALVAAGAIKPEDELLRQAIERAAALSPPQRGSLMGKAPAPPPASWNFIKLSTKAGQKSGADFRIHAEKGVNGWTFKIVTVDGDQSRTDFKGDPRQKFPDQAWEIGTDAARDALVKYNDEIKGFAAAVDQALADEKKAKAEALEAKRAAIFALLKPGAILWGLLEGPGQPPVPFGIMLDKADATGAAFPVRLLLPDDFPDLQPGNLRVKKDMEAAFPVTLSLIEDMNAELDLKDGGFSGAAHGTDGTEVRLSLAPRTPPWVNVGKPSRNGTNEGLRLSLSPISNEKFQQEKEAAAQRVTARKAREAEQLRKEQEAKAEQLRKEKEAEAERLRLEKEAEAQRAAAEAERIKQEKEAAAQREAARKKHEAEYAVALAKALAPGSAFKGTWRYGGSDYGIAFALTEVDEKSLSAKGFLFDPLEIGKRKPFTAAINRAVDADNALVIQAAPNAGSDNTSSHVQNIWISKNRTYNLTLRLTDEGHWEGSASDNDRQSYNFSPIPGFAEVLQAEEKTRQERRAALEKATAAGSTWLGAATYNNSTVVVGVYFEKNTGDILSGRFFDPDDPSQSKEFSGSRFPDQDKAKLTMAYESGVARNYKGGSFPSIASWLMRQERYEVTLQADGQGASSGGWSLRLSPSPDSYPALLAKKKAEEQANREAILALVQPGSRYKGTWKRERDSIAGEIGLLFTELRTVSVRAEVYDPADPQTTWRFTGSVNPEAKEGEHAITLQPDYVHKEARKASENSTPYLLNQHSSSSYKIVLDRVADGLRGTWNISYEPRIALKQVESGRPAAAKTAPAAAPSTTAAPVNAASDFPALQPKADGKPQAVAHRVSLEGQTARLAVQVLAPGKTLTAVRIDNVGGLASAWRSDGKESAAPLQVLANGKELNTGAAVMSAAMGKEEQRFDLVFTDNGALAGGATDLRITLFFADNTRTMCLLAHQ